MDRMTKKQITENIQKFGVLREKVLGEKPVAEPEVVLPPSHSSESLVGDIRNQRKVGACVGFGLTKYLVVARRCNEQLFDIEEGNPGWVYTLAKVFDNKPSLGGLSDTRYEEQRGTTLIAACAAAEDIGVVPLHMFPPMESEDPKLSEHQVCAGLLSARDQKIKSYQSLLWEGQTKEQLLRAIKKAILETGGALMGIAVTTAWPEYDGGPLIESPYVIGGHCVMNCAYDDAAGEFLFPNSWGVDYGIKGFVRYPYKQVKKHLISAYRIGV